MVSSFPVTRNQLGSFRVNETDLFDDNDSEGDFSDEDQLTTRPQPAFHHHCPHHPTHCAELTTYRHGEKHVLLVSVDKPITIGRNASLCEYQVPDAVVSNVHCKLYAVYTHNGTVIVSCQDMSSNGIILNGVKVHRQTLILCEGDRLQIPKSQEFECHLVQTVKISKKDVFDSTPSQTTKPHRHKKLEILQYIVNDHTLGSGSYGKVYLAMDMKKKKQVACKTIRLSKTGSATWPSEVHKEIDLLRRLRHPNINYVIDMETQDKFTFLFLELSMGGDLDMYIRMHRRLPEDETKYISYQIMLGLVYLHEREIAHRDLKPENVLLHEAGRFPRAILADFGLARPQAYEATLRVVGTISYLPPEAIVALRHKNMSYVGQPSDCWALGCCIYIMLDGLHPFDYGSSVTSYRDFGIPLPNESSIMRNPDDVDSDGESIGRIMSNRSERLIGERIKENEPRYSREFWCLIPEGRVQFLVQAYWLVTNLLIEDPENRLNIQGALNSTWVISDLSQLDRLYEKRVLPSRPVAPPAFAEEDELW